MSISLLLEMAASSNPDRTAVVSGELRLTTSELSELADGGAGVIAASGAHHAAYVGTGGVLLPLLLFSSARAGVAFTPLNYRLSQDGLRQLVDRLPTPLVIADAEYRDVVVGAGKQVISSDEFIAAARTTDPAAEFADPDDVGVVLFTSGTTSRPKAVELTHNNLTSYITGTVEFDSAEPGDAALICVPPYHIAGVSAALSNLYAGRKMVYLPQFDATEWVRLVRDEGVTSATVVPTMLDRIVAVLEAEPVELPALRNLAYGGAKVALPLVRKALGLLPDVGFVNAYGLTETSSTIAVLTPDDHREALASDDPDVRRRLGSVGRPSPSVEISIRDPFGEPVPEGDAGEIWVRGEQVSGEYIGREGGGDWFATRDGGFIDTGGFLYIEGRLDDVIVRGGENISPGEIEDVLRQHPAVDDVAVYAIPSQEWGEDIGASVVLIGTVDADELRDWVRSRLRSTRVPTLIDVRTELPYNETGKLLRRVLKAE